MSLKGSAQKLQSPALSTCFGPAVLGLLIFLIPVPLYSHDGELDQYGCHYGASRNEYHCHRGEFTGLSFNSKIEMVRLLTLQNLNRGHVLPESLVEEDITSAPITETSPEAEIPSSENKKEQPEATEPSVSAGETRKRDAEENSQPSESETKEITSPSNEKKPAPAKQTASKQKQSVRVVGIRADGTVEFEGLRGERFYLDDNGKKVYLRRKP